MAAGEAAWSREVLCGSNHQASRSCADRSGTSHECWSWSFQIKTRRQTYLLIQGNEKHKTAAMQASRFMFPQHSSHSLVATVPDTVAVRTLAEGRDRQATITELLPYFLAWLTHELRRSPWTIRKYQDCMCWVVRTIGDISPQHIRLQHTLLIKARCAERNAGPSRVASMMCALKAFLNFCRLVVGLDTMDPKCIRAPRIPKREVVFLTPEEVRQFVEAIPIRKSPRVFHVKWLCFRVLVEVLLGTGMRISEALSLKRSTINFQTGEAQVVGKGNKERTVFFSPRALNWVKEYLNRRTDREDAMFLATGNKPLRLATAIVWFGRFRKQAGIKKKVTAHTLRHTVATTLLFNGCPIGHIKEILGHENLITTCKFYLGVDKRAAKEAHRKYLDFDAVPEQPVDMPHVDRFQVTNQQNW